MRFNKYWFLVMLIFTVGGCSSFPTLDEVLPDNRVNYQRSKTLPDLEIPPDLTQDVHDDVMTIPGEERVSTLSEFQRQQIVQGRGQLSDAEISLLENADEKWLIVSGTMQTIWPHLREFWQAKEISLDLDDADLGVMETDFKEIDEADGTSQQREKFKLFSEEGDVAGTLVLFLSSEVQKPSLDENTWITTADRSDREEQLIGELKRHFYAEPSPVTPDETDSLKEPESEPEPEPATEIELIVLDDGKAYLSIAEELTVAWHGIEHTLNESSLLSIERVDEEQGTFLVRYQNDGEHIFSLSISAVSNTTELVALDAEGQWSDSEIARQLLEQLQQDYRR